MRHGSEGTGGHPVSWISSDSHVWTLGATYEKPLRAFREERIRRDRHRVGPYRRWHFGCDYRGRERSRQQAERQVQQHFDPAQVIGSGRERHKAPAKRRGLLLLGAGTAHALRTIMVLRANRTESLRGVI